MTFLFTVLTFVAGLLVGVGVRLWQERRRTTGDRPEVTQSTTAQRSLEHLQELAGLGTWRLDPHTGRVEASDQVFRITSVPKGPHDIERALSWVHPDDLELAGGQLGALLADREPAITEVRIQPPDGPLKTVRVCAMALRDEHGEIAEAFGTVQDVTRRRHAEDELRRREQHYVLACEGGKVGVWDWDLNLGEVYLSQTQRELLGVSDQPVTVERWQRYVHPEDRTRNLAALQQHIAGERDVYEDQHRLVLEDGTVRWVQTRGRLLRDANDKIVRLVGFNTDITERRQSEQAWRESEERFRQIAENVSEVFILVQAQPPEVLYINPQCEHIYGYSFAELGADPERWLNTLHPDDREAVGATIEELITRRLESGRSAEFRVVHPGGEIRWLRSLLDPIRDSSGTVVRYAVTTADITESKEAQELQRTLFEELDHRVKNTLNVAIALAEQAAASATSVEGFKETFIGRLRTLASAHEILAGRSWGSIELSDLSARVVDSLSPRGSVDLEGETLFLPASCAFPVALVLHELATNAVKHGCLSEPGGRLTLGWERERRDDRASIRLRWIERAGPELQSSPAPGGGLGIVQALVNRQLGGELEMRFEPNGLRVQIRFDVLDSAATNDPTPAPMPTPVAREVEPPSGTLDGLRVLIVEDDVLQADLLGRMLARLGCCIVGPAMNMAEGLELAQGAQIDGALLDLKLGHQRSTPIAEALHARKRPFVMLSGFAELDRMPPVIANAPHLIKPVEPPALEAAIRTNFLECA